MLLRLTALALAVWLVGECCPARAGAEESAADSRARAVKWALLQRGKFAQPCATRGCLHNPDEPGPDACTEPVPSPDDADRSGGLVMDDGHLTWFFYCARFAARAYGRNSSGFATAADMHAAVSRKLSTGEPTPGSLVFWRWSKSGHVGVCVGRGHVAHTGLQRTSGVSVEPISAITAALNRALPEGVETSLLGWFDPTGEPLSWGTAGPVPPSPPPAPDGEQTTVEAVLSRVPAEFGSMPPPAGVEWGRSFDAKRVHDWFSSYLGKARPFCEFVCYHVPPWNDPPPYLNDGVWRFHAYLRFPPAGSLQYEVPWLGYTQHMIVTEDQARVLHDSVRTNIPIKIRARLVGLRIREKDGKWFYTPDLEEESIVDVGVHLAPLPTLLSVSGAYSEGGLQPGGEYDDLLVLRRDHTAALRLRGMTSSRSYEVVVHDGVFKLEGAILTLDIKGQAPAKFLVRQDVLVQEGGNRTLRRVTPPPSMLPTQPKLSAPSPGPPSAAPTPGTASPPGEASPMLGVVTIANGARSRFKFTVRASDGGRPFLDVGTLELPPGAAVPVHGLADTRFQVAFDGSSAPGYQEAVIELRTNPVSKTVAQVTIDDGLWYQALEVRGGWQIRSIQPPSARAPR